MHEKLTSAIMIRAVPQLSFQPRHSDGIGTAGKDGASRNSQWQLRGCSSGHEEIFRRNTATGSVRQTVIFLELRSRDNAMKVEGKID